MNIYGEYFYGNKISEYGLERGFVDYATLAKAFDAVLNNEIIEKTLDIGGYWESNGNDYNPETDEYAEIYQYYIVDDNGAEILDEAGEIVFRNEYLDLNVWGVTHYGTAWAYVLTDIPCNTGKI